MHPGVAIDARVYDGVVFGLGALAGSDVTVSDAAVTLLRKLHTAGVRTAVLAPGGDPAPALCAAGLDEVVVVDATGASGLIEAAQRMGVPAERIAVLDSAGAGIAAARTGGLGMVIGVGAGGDADELLAGGADVVVDDVARVSVPSGFRRFSALPNALESYGQLVGVTRSRPVLAFVDVDAVLPGTPDSPPADHLTDAVAALGHLAEQCPVVVLDGGDLADLDDLRSRVGVSGIWYATSHEVMAPDDTRQVNETADPAVGAAGGDTAKRLSWIRGKVAGGGDVLPIYVGSGLKDEPAFDALRLDGVGIVVRGADPDRQSAANFVLESPEQVCEFLNRGANWLGYQRATSGGAWTLTYDDFDPHNEKLREALCTVGNGYFATRGAAPEAKAGQVHYPGTYAAGLYNRLADNVSGVRVENESLVNLPNWLPLTFRINQGSWFDIGAVTILAYRQTLDLRHAVLIRYVRFRDNVGHTTSLTQRRFVAMHRRHVAALETTILAEDWSGELEIRSTIDGAVRNSLVERYRDLSSDHLDSLATAELSENSVLLSARTTQSRVPIAIAARNTVWRNNAEVPATFRFFDQDRQVGHEIGVDVSVGDSVTVEKAIVLVTGRDVATSEPSVDAALWVNRLDRFKVLREGHEKAWAQLWERMSIELAGHNEQLKVIRLHLLHLLQTVSLNSADVDAGVPARGLHGEAYRGLIFWDELFIFPVLNMRFPMITRALLRYRYRRLPEARQAASEAGYAGAMFPWQSGSSGREECQRMHLNPRSGHWNPDASALAHHIGLAVAYNAWQFYQATADLAYLIDYGAELLVEIARFWVSRTDYDADRDRYLIRGVIGPDEFHSGYPDAPHDGIDNNAYTNVMAVWAILRAFDALELLPLPNRLDLLEKLGVDDAELARWRVVSRRMFVPFHDGIISQFEGYEKLADLDWDDYRKRYGDIHRLDRILEAEDDDINRYKASKQADALMLLYLLSADELSDILQHLGYHLPPSRIPHLVEYYIARTSHGSTLSAVVHSWVLARSNRDRAMEFFDHVLSSDVTDIQGGTTSEGIHTAAMAGSVDLVQRCFTGLEFRRDRIVISPNWPKQLGALGFPIHYRGLHLYLRVNGSGAEVTVEPRDAPPVQIEYRGRVRLLEPGSTLRFT